MKNRLPTTFETKVLKRIANNRMLAGNGMVAISAACHRLEGLGYAAHPRALWYVTDKGDEWLATESRRTQDAADLLSRPACCASFVFDGTHHKDCRLAQTASG